MPLMVSPLRELLLIMLRNVEHLPALLQRGEQIVYANAGLQRLFGYPPETLLTMRAMDLAAPEEWPRLRQYYAERQGDLLSILAPTIYQCRALHQDGHRFEVNVTVCCAPHAEGELLFFLLLHEESATALVEFATQTSEYLHEWSKSYLRHVAANVMQAQWGQLELSQANMQERLEALEARQQWLRTKTVQTVKYGVPSLMALGQEPWIGAGKALVKWIARLMS